MSITPKLLFLTAQVERHFFLHGKSRFHLIKKLLKNLIASEIEDALHGLE